MDNNGYLPLFETSPARGLVFFRSYAASIFIGICFICFHRLSYFPVLETTTERWVWVGMLVAELWFSFYFFITVIVKWNPVFRSTFKDRLSSRSSSPSFYLSIYSLSLLTLACFLQVRRRSTARSRHICLHGRPKIRATNNGGQHSVIGHGL